MSLVNSDGRKRCATCHRLIKKGHENRIGRYFYGPTCYERKLAARKKQQEMRELAQREGSMNTETKVGGRSSHE